MLWRTPIPGLAHSSPIVWGNRIFVTSAVSSAPNGDLPSGLVRRRRRVRAIDRRSAGRSSRSTSATGKIIWQRVAFEGEPIDKRHVKSTYASATPATDGRIVVAWFGSQGVHAYDVNGNFLLESRPRPDELGAYDIPTYEWGPASSPIIWNGLVILQCDTQADSFLLALKADTGETVWKTAREELPSWGTPTRGDDLGRAAARDQRVELHSRLRPAHRARSCGGSAAARRSLRRRRSSPTAWSSLPAAAGPSVRSSSMRPGARGDLTLDRRQDRAATSVVWSRTGRGPYMPTPLVYQGHALRARQQRRVRRLRPAHRRGDLPPAPEPVGSGFSASPVAADGKIYLSNEDGDMFVDRSRAGVQADRDELDGRAVDGHAGVVGRRHVRAHGRDLSAIGQKVSR